jgi:hypothetical protein
LVHSLLLHSTVLPIPHKVQLNIIVTMTSEIAALFDAFRQHVQVRDRRQLTGLLLKDCFVGSEAVDAMIGAKVTKRRDDATFLIRRLQKELRVFRPVRGNQRFQDSKRHFYRLTIPDSIKDTASLQAFADTSNENLDLSEKAKLFFQLANVGDRKQGLKKYSSCFVACEIVDRLVYCGLVKSRMDGVRLGRTLAREMELFDHVNRKHNFSDDSSLYCFSPGVLKVIYELHKAEREHGTCFPAKQVKNVVEALHNKPALPDSKMSTFERLIHGRSKKYESNIVLDAVEVTSDDDESVLSAPEMSQSATFVDDCHESVISHSNSFDTLNDIIIKQGRLQPDAMSLYSTFEDSYGFPQHFEDGMSVLLRGRDNIGGDGSRVKFTLPKGKQIPRPSPFCEKSLLCEDGSIVSESEDPMDGSPRNVTDVKKLTSDPTLRKGMAETSMYLPEAQSTLYSSRIKLSSIVVEKRHEDDDMTQITIDKCIATVASMEQDGEMVISTASTEEEDIAQLLMRCTNTNSRPQFKSPSPEISKISSSSSDRQRRPQSFSKLSNQSTFSSFQSTETSKQRISRILRKDLWSVDNNVVGLALEELCESLEDDLAINGAHVVYCGGVMALKRTLEEHLQVETIQYYGCVALGKLASLDLDAQGAISEMDGIPLVVRSMQHHVDSSRLQEAGRSALASICWRSDI